MNDKEREEFNKKWEKVNGSQGRDKLWNYFLDLLKTEKFQNEIEDFKKRALENKSMHHWDSLVATMIDYGFDGYE